MPIENRPIENRPIEIWPSSRTWRTAAALAGVVLLALPPRGAVLAADAALIAAAKKEGEVVWYTTQIVNQFAAPLAAEFEKKYGVRVKYARKNSNATILAVLNEAKAGRVQADVVDGTQTLPALQKEGLVLKWTPDSAARLPDTYRDKAGYWVATNLYVMTPTFNTNLVPKGSEPKTWDDLLDPKWKGKMAWAGRPSTSGGPGFVATVVAELGEEKGLAYLKKLAGQNIAPISGAAREVMDQVVAGEYAICLNCFNHHAVISAEKGAPAHWTPMQPAVMVNLSAVGILKDGKNQNAAKLLVDFLVSREGQKFFADANYLPVDKTVDTPLQKLIPEGGGFKGIFFTPEQTAELMPQWMKTFKEIFR